MSIPGPRPRRTVRSLGHPLPCLLGMALLIAGCGSPQAAPSHAADSSTDSAQASQSEPSPSGPCDREHRDAAIAAARAALRKRLGALPMHLPQAEFECICLTPQVPGRPAAAPVAGWMVSFLAGSGGEDDQGRTSATELPELTSPLASGSNAMAGRTEITMADRPRPADGAPSAETTPALPGPPAGGSPGANPAQPVALNAFATLGPDGVAGTSIRRYAVFVQVDGTISNF